MEPPEQTDGNLLVPQDDKIDAQASMEPPEQTDGNHSLSCIWNMVDFASMEPPEQTDGNPPYKLACSATPSPASMEPPEQTDGNLAKVIKGEMGGMSFNGATRTN